MIFADVTAMSLLQTSGAVLAVVLGVAGIVGLVVTVKVYYKGAISKQKETRDLNELQLANERVTTLKRELDTTRAEAKESVAAEKRRGEELADKLSKLVDLSDVKALLEVTSGNQNEILAKLADALDKSEKRSEERHAQQTAQANAAVASMDALANVVREYGVNLHMGRANTKMPRVKKEAVAE